MKTIYNIKEGIIYISSHIGEKIQCIKEDEGISIETDNAEEIINFYKSDFSLNEKDNKIFLELQDIESSINFYSNILTKTKKLLQQHNNNIKIMTNENLNLINLSINNWELIIKEKLDMINNILHDNPEIETYWIMHKLIQ